MTYPRAQIYIQTFETHMGLLNLSHSTSKRFFLLLACMSISPSLLADILDPSLIPVKNAIHAKLISGEEIIKYSKEPPFLVYINEAGDDAETALLKEHELSGYITAKFPTDKISEIKPESQFFITSTIFIRKPSIFEKYLAANNEKCFYEIQSKYGRFLMGLTFFSDHVFAPKKPVTQALLVCING